MSVIIIVVLFFFVPHKFLKIGILVHIIHINYHFMFSNQHNSYMCVCVRACVRVCACVVPK